MKKNLLISVLMTIVTTVLLGLVYPLVVTALAQLFFRDKANGQLVQRNGMVVASERTTASASCCVTIMTIASTDCRLR